MTEQYNANLIVMLKNIIKEKGRGKLRRSFFSIAPVHTSKAVKLAIQDCGLKEIDHSASSDYYLFSDLKKNLQGKSRKNIFRKVARSSDIHVSTDFF